MKRIALAFLKLVTVVIICTVLDWFAGYGESKNDIAVFEQREIGTTCNAAFRSKNLANPKPCPRGGKEKRRYDFGVSRDSEPANNDENMFSGSETSHMK